MDLFTQKRFELMIEMATKKLQQEITILKECILSLNKDMGSLKSQISRLQFEQPSQQASALTANTVQRPEAQFANAPLVEQNIPQKKDVKIIDCRPENERQEQFQSGAAKNAEPIRPRFGNYKPEDVSIDKFFYFGRK